MAKRLKIVAIGLFVIVDLLAAMLAIRHVKDRPVSHGPSLIVSSVSPPATPLAVEPRAPEPTGLAVTGNLISTFVSGTCDTPGEAQLALSTDKAATFREIDLPLDNKVGANGTRGVAVTSILGVTITSATRLSLIGRDVSCTASRFTTDDGGKSWRRADSINDWYVDRGRVGTPAGVVGPDCTAVSVWPISDRNARVGCKDHQVRGTDDTGTTWVGLGALDGSTAVSFSSTSFGFGVAVSSNCASRAYSTGSAGSNWQPLGCINKDRRAVALSGTGGLLAALIDRDVYVSTDQGKIWKRP